jgi:acetoin:2,6-dichlorophenolindophenol oxidoreductase subunit alpha
MVDTIKNQQTDPVNVVISPEKMKTFLKEMLLIRVFEQRTEELIVSGHIPGSTHLSIGQEAVAVGVMQALKQADYVAGPHRGHHILLAKGLDVKTMMAELMAKATGLCAGKGGHMHMADYSKGMLGVNGIVGASVAIATGAAFTAHYLERDQVAVAFFGDGGVNKGQFHENLNMASILNLPVIYVCENNQYAVETSVAYSTAGNNIAGRAASYDFPGIVVDGLDVLDVYSVVVEARKRAIIDKRPTLIEAKTYRFKGHHMGDVENYRTKDEVLEWMKKDPILKLRLALEEQGLLTDSAWKLMQEEVKQQVEEAVRFGMESPNPEPSSVMDNVYSMEVKFYA